MKASQSRETTRLSRKFPPLARVFFLFWSLSHLAEDLVGLLELGVEALGLEADDGSRLHVVVQPRVPVERVEELEVVAQLVTCAENNFR